jgi:hypothetical protein
MDVDRYIERRGPLIDAPEPLLVGEAAMREAGGGTPTIASIRRSGVQKCSSIATTFAGLAMVTHLTTAGHQ